MGWWWKWDLGEWTVKEGSKSPKVDGKNIQLWYMVRDVFSNHRKKSDTMIVDQPAGTGFSYTSTNNYVHTLEQVSPSSVFHSILILTPTQASEQWLQFLRNFYKVFPEYRRMDVWLSLISSAFMRLIQFRHILAEKVMLDSTYLTSAGVIRLSLNTAH